jgi:putative PEP-CTERM system TPR-repeat lipoprotein
MVVLLCLGCAQRAEDPVQLMASAKQEREGGNHRAAIIHLKNLLQQVPQHAEARFLVGTIYLEAGDAVAAQSELRRAIDAGYDRTKAIPALGRSLLMSGEFQKVLDELREEGTPEGVQAELLTLRARAAIGLGQRKVARQLLEQALAMKPAYADALLGQARLAASEERYEQATTLVARALASAPEDADAWLMKGDLSRFVNDRNGALVAYEKALAARPNNNAPRVSIAFLHIDSGDYAEAGREVEQIRKLAPQSPMAGYLEALIAYRKRDYPAARSAVQQVLDIAPDHMPSVLLRGAVEFASGAQGVAQSYLERVVNSIPDNLNARRLLIASLAQSGKVQRALELIDPALKRHPEDSALIALAGEIYLLDNQFAQASRFFEKWATLDPKNARARTGLGLSLLASGETNGALANLESASRLDQSQYQADILLVTSHLRRANYDAALKAMDRLERKQPDNPLTYNLKAAIYVGTKDLPSARANLQHALRVQPLYVPAAMNLASPARVDCRQRQRQC